MTDAVMPRRRDLADPILRGRLYVGVAALAWSTAGVLQRGLSIDTGTQLAGRALFAMLGLLAFVAVVERRNLVRAFLGVGRPGIAFAVCMAISSGTFIIALNRTSVANVLFMQAVSPIVAALLARLVLGEAVTRRTWIAMVAALAGVGVMVGGPGGFSIGVGISVVMMLSFAVGLVFVRARSDISMAPAMCLAQLLILVVSAPLAHPGTIGGHDLGLLVGFAGQIAVGLALLSFGARLIPAAEIALISLLEVVLAPLWVWIAQSERPATTTIAGGVVVVVAVAFQVAGQAGFSAAAGVPATLARASLRRSRRG